MSVALALGALVGAGVWLAVGALRPARPSLAEARARLHAVAPPAPAPVTGRSTWVTQLGRPLAALMGRSAPPPLRAGVQQDLLILGRTAEEHLARKLGAAVALFALGVAWTAVLAAGRVAVPGAVAVGVPLLMAAIGYVMPDLAVPREAAARRREFRHALSAYLDLVSVALAGGRGLEGALTAAADRGRGWVFERLRRAVETARLTREPPWLALRRLGGELGIGELESLAASVALAGGEGAAVSASLAARAASLRARRLAEAEAEAQSATVRMGVPVAVLGIAFVAFIVFPALMRVLGS